MRDRIQAVIPVIAQRWTAAVAVAVIVAGLAAIAVFSTTRPPAAKPLVQDPAHEPAMATAGTATPTATEASRAVASGEPVVDAALLATPEAKAYFARERFNARARAFFADAATLTPAARQREARELESAIDAYERTRELSAGEAMKLRLGLVEASSASAAERTDRMAAIVARYESDGRQREANWLAQQAGDSAFVRYKARESVVVAEVMAMTQIPDGLSRDEYLRRRLEAERVAAMQ